MKEINSLELSFLIKSIKQNLASSKIQKIKQISDSAFSFELYKQKKPYLEAGRKNPWL